jgi:hypothetical protein
MLFVSLMTTAFALFPRLPVSFGLAPQAGWQLSFAAFFVVWFFYIVPSRRRFSAVSENYSPSRRRLGDFHFAVHGLLGIALLLGSFGVWGDSSEAVYLSSLFVLMYMAGYLFVRLFLELLARTAG